MKHLERSRSSPGGGRTSALGQGTGMTFGSGGAFCNRGFLRAASGTGELLGRERRKAGAAQLTDHRPWMPAFA